MNQAADSTIRCEKCGVAFACEPEGACWCKDESFRLPMPTGASNCLCPNCLREMAKEQAK